MTTPINELIELMEPSAANASVNTLHSAGLQSLAQISSAISLRRIADAVEKPTVDIRGMDEVLGNAVNNPSNILAHHRMYSIELQAFRWMKNKIEEHPEKFFASHPTPQNSDRKLFPNPPNVDHAFSGSVKRGVRIWAFETIAERDQFLKDWPTAKEYIP